jgi:hypothetical protein
MERVKGQTSAQMLSGMLDGLSLSRLGTEVVIGGKADLSQTSLKNRV